MLIGDAVPQGGYVCWSPAFPGLSAVPAQLQAVRHGLSLHDASLPVLDYIRLMLVSQVRGPQLCISYLLCQPGRAAAAKQHAHYHSFVAAAARGHTATWRHLSTRAQHASAQQCRCGRLVPVQAASETLTGSATTVIITVAVVIAATSCCPGPTLQIAIKRCPGIQQAACHVRAAATRCTQTAAANHQHARCSVTRS